MLYRLVRIVSLTVGPYCPRSGRWNRPGRVAAAVLSLLIAGCSDASDAGDGAQTNAAAGSAKARSAVVLEYHHVDTQTPAATSVTPEQFEAHLEHLAANEFHVWPLPRLVRTLRRGDEVPARTVAITFDDAYVSVYEEAFPRLQERGWPFTVFVAPGITDKGYELHASWDQLREMEAAGATMANHSMDHPHMVARGERSREQWLAAMRAQVTDAQDRLERELEDPAQLFAWPFGEFSPPLQQMLAELDFVGFGQQSGAFGPQSDFTALPRYPYARSQQSLDTFDLKVRSRPLPVVATEPDSGVLGAEARRPELSLSLGPGAYQPEDVRCYVGGSPAEFELDADASPPILHIRPPSELGTGRTKINGTAPARDGNHWLWYSFVWMKPNPDGSWYRD